MSLFKYTENQAGIQDIETHLERCSDLFYPGLSSVVDIHDYSTKIRVKSHTFECWADNVLVGLIACYFNDNISGNAFITNVSIIKEEQRKNIASVLLAETIKKALELKFIKISLEVHRDNIKAIRFYQKFDFVFFDQSGRMDIMERRLDE